MLFKRVFGCWVFVLLFFLGVFTVWGNDGPMIAVCPNNLTSWDPAEESFTGACALHQLYGTLLFYCPDGEIAPHLAPTTWSIGKNRLSATDRGAATELLVKIQDASAQEVPKYLILRCDQPYGGQYVSQGL